MKEKVLSSVNESELLNEVESVFDGSDDSDNVSVRSSVNEPRLRDDDCESEGVPEVSSEKVRE